MLIIGAMQMMRVRMATDMMFSIIFKLSRMISTTAKPILLRHENLDVAHTSHPRFYGCAMLHCPTKDDTRNPYSVQGSSGEQAMRLGRH